MIFESAYCYLQSASSLKDKIDKIDQIISALLMTAEKSASNDNITEYSLNDGQTVIKTVYKGTDAVVKSIESFEKLRQIYVNQYNNRKNGRIIRLVDGKNFI